MISSPSTDRIRERAQIKVRTWLWRKHWRREDDVDSNRRSERKIKVTFLPYGTLQGHLCGMGPHGKFSPALRQEISNLPFHWKNYPFVEQSNCFL